MTWGRRKRGSTGELAATYWFQRHGWTMFRTQPETDILGVLTPEMLRSLTPWFRHLRAMGHMVLARLSRGGIADFTGWALCETDSEEGLVPGKGRVTLKVIFHQYRACEVKEATGDTMPASRLAPEQRAWMDTVPEGCRFVGILWGDGTFEVFSYVPRGSYRKGDGER